MWRVAAVAIALALIAAPAWLAIPGMWWYLLRWALYVPIVLLSARYGPVAGLFAGLAASLLWTIAAASRGMGEMAWLSILTADFAIVGLLGGKFVEVWQRFKRGRPANGRNAWPAPAPISGRETSLDLTPLASIESAAGLLAEDDTPAELRQELFGIISTECSRLSVSITGLMERSPAAAQAHVCEADIAAIADAAVREAAFVLCGRRVMVSKEIAPELPPIQCNPDHIRALIMNLVVNAVQSAPAGDEVVLNVHCGNDGVVLDVKYRAKGSFFSRVIKHFFLSRPVSTGGNFAAAYDIVRQHGGTIEGSLNVKRGLEFSVWLPLHRNYVHGTRQSTSGGG